MRDLEVWIIRHKVTKKQWIAASGKSSWSKPRHAKCAWASTYRVSWVIPNELKPFLKTMDRYEGLKFNDQDLYECVDISTEVALDSEELQELEKPFSEDALNQLNNLTHLSDFVITTINSEEIAVSFTNAQGNHVIGSIKKNGTFIIIE